MQQIDRIGPVVVIGDKTASMDVTLPLAAPPCRWLQSLAAGYTALH
jgi:hypothetical protein